MKMNKEDYEQIAGMIAEPVLLYWNLRYVGPIIEKLRRGEALKLRESVRFVGSAGGLAYIVGAAMYRGYTAQSYAETFRRRLRAATEELKTQEQAMEAVDQRAAQARNN